MCPTVARVQVTVPLDFSPPSLLPLPDPKLDLNISCVVQHWSTVMLLDVLAEMQETLAGLTTALPPSSLVRRRFCVLKVVHLSMFMKGTANAHGRHKLIPNMRTNLGLLKGVLLLTLSLHSWALQLPCVLGRQL